MGPNISTIENEKDLFPKRKSSTAYPNHSQLYKSQQVYLGLFQMIFRGHFREISIAFNDDLNHANNITHITATQFK